MRKIICRFRNKEDLDAFSNGMLDKDVKEVIFEDYAIKEIKRKKPVTKKGERKKFNEYMSYWKGMPEFVTDFHKSDYAKIDFIFNDGCDGLEWAKELFQQNITDKTTSVWFPKLIPGANSNLRVLGGREGTKYPIFVVSRGRYNEYRWHTSNHLSRIGLPHYIVVEPQEEELYKNSKIGQSKWATVLVMDMSWKDRYDTCNDIYPTNVGETGPGAARNFCMEYAQNVLGVKKCWSIDDNAERFSRYWRGRRILALTPEVFRSLEDFCDRYENIGIAGHQYSKFCVDETELPPFVTNTRIYSCTLHNLECPQHLQRGRWNEDSINSLDILDAGWCSVEWNAYLIDKITTQKRQGGNTEIFYNEKVDIDKTRYKSEMLEAVWPKYAKVVHKFHRTHHVINFDSFTQKLKLKPEYEGVDFGGTEEHGVYIVRIPDELKWSDLDNREDLMRMFPRGCAEDVTDSNLFLE